MQLEGVTLFQRVAELFLVRLHGHSKRGGTASVGGDEKARLERRFLFLLKYGLDPEFRIAMESEMLKDPATAEWREELGFVLALELVLARNGHWLFQEIVSRSRLEELQSVYPEVFERRGAEGQPDALALIRMASAAEGGDDPSLEALAKALDSVFPEGYEAEEPLAAMGRQGTLLQVEPGWMSELDSFHAILASDMEKILAKLGERPEVDREDASAVQGRNGTVEMLFGATSEATLLRWFSSLDDEASETMLSASNELSWDETSMSRGLELRMAWAEEAAKGVHAIMEGADAYRQYGRPDAALFIYRSVVENQEAGLRTRAEAHNRMAVIHREGGRTHEAFLEFQEADILWEKLGARWESAVTGAYVAEGYYHEGKREKASKYLEEAFELMAGAEESKERMARGHFYLAACAHTIGRFDLERRALETGIELAQGLEDGELFLKFNDRLLSLGR